MPAKYLGRCWACEHYPVAFDAPTCPRCGVKSPNPGLGERYAKRGLIIGFSMGSFVGGILMAITSDRDPVIGFMGGSILGCLPGLIFGVIAGKIVGAVMTHTQSSAVYNEPRNEDDRYTE